MSQASVKKARERRDIQGFLDALKLAYPDFPITQLDNSEGPDFLLRTKDQLIGIEHTEYMQSQGPDGSPLRKYESLRARIAIKARQSFTKRFPSAPPIYVDLLWLPSETAQNLNGDAQNPPEEFLKSMHRAADTLAEAIVGVTGANIPANTNEEILIDGIDLDAPLDRWLYSLRVFRQLEGSTTTFALPDEGTAGRYASEIQARIAGKDANFDGYHLKCQAFWLVIVGGGSNISSQIELDNSEVAKVNRMRFGRVFLYNRNKPNLFLEFGLKQNDGV